MLNYKARNSDSVLLKSYLWFLKFYSWARNLPIMGSIFRFGYALLLLGKTNWKEAKEYKKEYSKLGHKISWYDVVSSYFKHGSIAKEYFIYRFFEKEPEERAFWVTEGIRFCFDKPLHIPLMPLIWDKYNFYSKYHKYMGREIILLDNNSNLNEVDEWCRTRGKFVVKPRMGFGGGGG